MIIQKSVYDFFASLPSNKIKDNQKIIKNKFNTHNKKTITTDILLTYNRNPFPFFSQNNTIPADSLCALLNPRAMIDSFIIDGFLNTLQYKSLDQGHKWYIGCCHLFTSIFTDNTELAIDSLKTNLLRIDYRLNLHS